MTSSREQFGRVAEAYAESWVHARGADLERLNALVQPSGTLVDVGTGAGHTLAAVAAKFDRAIGLDPTPQMLAAARGVLRDRGVHAHLVEADAAALPLADSMVDVVTSRVAAHHFPDAPRAFGEMARVLRPGGALYLIDNCAPEEPALDKFINGLERLRDPSHVRAYSLSEWLALLSTAGFRPKVDLRDRVQLNVEDWLARSQTPPPAAAEVRDRLRRASAAAREAFTIDETHFSTNRVIIVGTKT
ncbi:MAG: hypothetical protein AUH85_03965 [Chloroflexi bacterium 13_1_40CM_4_68_4]|nr:MAG: hypothetical protein AUH85_03965 [Chloroflexi bacterium 13_1_40CM_4_68_4]